MRHTTGHHAYMAALGGGFRPGPDWRFEGVSQGDGTYLTEMSHPDGRTLTLTTKRCGNGITLGKFVKAAAAGPWNPACRVARAQFPDWWAVRELLAIHDPARQEPYCGGKPQRQMRRLDGRERDILTRIIRDIRTALRTKEQRDLLARVIYLDNEEIARLFEISAVLDPREED